MNASAQERAAQGKSRRDVVSRADQGKLNTAERGFDPIDLLRASNLDRIPQLLPIKYARMQESPFAFFRGSAAIMAADLGRLPHQLRSELARAAQHQDLHGASSGHAASLSEVWEQGSGQRMARRGSSHRMPPSSAGE